MTLEEAIKHAEEVAELNEWFDKNYLESMKCRECAEEHRQLAEWLKDYKRLLEQEPILDKIRAEIEDLDTHYDNDYFVGNKDAMFKCDEVMQIIDKYRGEADCHSCKTEHDCYECEKYGENEG